jgi:hypothetical protein
MADSSPVSLSAIAFVTLVKMAISKKTIFLAFHGFSVQMSHDRERRQVVPRTCDASVGLRGLFNAH